MGEELREGKAEAVEDRTAAPSERGAGRRSGDGARIWTALIIGVSIMVSCLFLSLGFVRFSKVSSNTIGATGSAHMDFEADQIIWRGSYSADGASSETAYRKISNDAAAVKKYLIEQGVSESEVVFSSVDIQKKYRSIYDQSGNYSGEVEDGYQLTQRVTITSGDLDKVEQISRDVSSLLRTGVEFTSESPEYYCSTLDELKLKLISEATDNARQRIDIIARESGAAVGKLVNSSLGVFQITAANTGTGDYSYDGYFDTSSRWKTASITVRLDYQLK